jgi:hypothetical protein
MTGRPTKYKPEYCEALIDHMAEGYTFESFGGVVGVCKDTLYEWIRTHSAFSYAQKVARTKQLLANEKLLKDIAKGKVRNANVTAQIFIMKNCHNWKDRIEQTNVDVTKEETDKLKQEAAELMKELE